MKMFGKVVKLPDGRVGTVVYSGLDGFGIKWGVHDPPESDFEGTFGGVVPCSSDCKYTDETWPWAPDAMLRKPYPSATFECVGDDYEIVDR